MPNVGVVQPPSLSHTDHFQEGEHVRLTAPRANVRSAEPCPPIGRFSLSDRPTVPDGAALLTRIALEHCRDSRVHGGAAQVSVRLGSGQLILERVAMSTGHANDDTNPFRANLGSPA